MADNIPSHHSSEKNKGTLVVAGGIAASLPLIATTVQFGPLAGLLSGSEFNAETWGHVTNYMTGLYNPAKIVDYYKYSWSQWPAATAVGGIFSLAIGAVPAITAAAMNPFRMFDLIHGDARLGNRRDVREMEKRAQVGIVGADKLVLGNWPKTEDRMALIETLSVLVLAPPGTGKTASFVVPSIIETDGSSFIVNDPKPELFEACSGHRAEIGHVFMINWSKTDVVDPDNLDDPEKTIFYPRFNVLSPQLTPPAGTAERDTYLDAIANVLSPGGDKGGKNDYFEQKGRAGLVGFLHYICSKVNDARDYEGLPEFWRGKEACIPMIVDMINEGLRRAAAENDRKKEEAAQAQSFYQGDAMSDWLKAIVGECEEKQYNPRASTEITPLISMAPNERSGILGTMDKAFIPFKNAAVRERTMSCDFLPSDLRGMPDPETGEIKPVTLFVCVNQSEAAAFATITSLLYEVFSREFLAYGPNQVNRNGVKLGKYPVCFMLDEFAKLPRIEAVMTGPDLGRSKATYYCLVAQSAAQIGKLYSKEDQEIIYATTAVKYVLPQNDKDTVQLICTMVGPTTIKKHSRSKSRGGDFKEWGKSNVSEGLEKVDLIRPGDIAGMKPGTHMLICQGFMNRPFVMDSVFWFHPKNKEMGDKVYNPRNNKGPKPSQPLPPHIHAKRVEEWKRNNAHFQPKTIAPLPRRNTDLDPDEHMAA